MNESNATLDWARGEIGRSIIAEAERKYGPLVPYAFGMALGFGLFLFMVAVAVEKKVGL